MTYRASQCAGVCACMVISESVEGEPCPSDSAVCRMGVTALCCGGNSCLDWEGVRTLPPDSSLSPQNASTFEDVAQVPSAYQKTVPIEAGECWQSESTVWAQGTVLVP